MAQGSPQNIGFPSISRETLEYAVQDIKDQYLGQDGHRKCIPQVVYLKELPSYNDFFAKFLVPNQLCVLTEAATAQWRSRQEWVCQDGIPNFDFLLPTFGDAKAVPVANCKCQEFSAHSKQEMKMSEFLAYWQQYREAGHPAQEDCLYLKDWHFTRDFPDYKAYTTCSFFKSDWINEFLDVSKDVDDDYRFVYMGPKNTWTSFHVDVFHSFSWSANICGRKRWIFFPPGEEVHLKDIHKSLVYDVTGKELEDSHKFPTAHEVQHKIEIIQQPGETIFVPSGWHHQVQNLEDTISINHNWLNGCNVKQCWTHLKAALADVEQEISDCRGMEGWDQQCQMILKSLTGMNYDEFFCFMESIANRRIDVLSTVQRKSENSTSHCATASPSSHGNSENQPSVSETTRPCPQSKGGSDTERASSQLDQHAEDPQHCPQSKGGSDTERASFKLDQHAEDTQPCPQSKGGSDTERASFKLDQHAEDTQHCPQSKGGSDTERASFKLDQHAEDTQPCPQSKGGSDTERASSQLDQHAEDTQHCPQSKGGSDTERASSQLDQRGEDVLNLCEGVELNGLIPNPPHWSLCNVNHAVFDLACVAMVLNDMRQHLSVRLVGPQAEERSNGKSDSDSRADSSTHDHQKGVKGYSLQAPDETSVWPEEMCRSIESLLKDVSRCLTAFGIEGSWKS